MALSSTGLLVTAAVLSGTVGAGAAVLVMEASRPTGSLPGAGISDADPTLDRKVADQDRELRALRAELAELRQGMTALRTAAPAAGPSPASGFRTAAGNSAGAGATPVEKPPAPVPEPEDASRQDRFARAGKLTEARVDRVAREIHLTDDQKALVIRVLEDRRERLREAFERARAANGDETAQATAREEATRIREEARKELEVSLTAEQMKGIERILGGGIPVGGGDAGFRNGQGGRRTGNGLPGGRRPGRREEGQPPR